MANGELGVVYREIRTEQELHDAATLIAVQELGEIEETMDVAEVMRGDSYVNLGAFVGDTLVAATSVNTCPNDQYDHGDAYLGYLVVEQSQRGQRIGSTLLQLAEERAKESGATGVWVLAHDVADSESHSPASFAERHGYRTFDLEDRMPMRKDLV